jgi:hypothetical protein
MSAINSYGEDFICEVVQVLHGTLSPTSVRTAQTEIEALSLKPGKFSFSF